jgi:hypothetical protein
LPWLTSSITSGLLTSRNTAAFIPRPPRLV